jgi:peptidyl-prolyl cis-trans isomerase C
MSNCIRTLEKYPVYRHIYVSTFLLAPILYRGIIRAMKFEFIRKIRPAILTGLIVISAFLVGCDNQVVTKSTPTLSATSAAPTTSPTVELPTATPVPLAARVNDGEITLAQYQAELERYKAEVGTELATNDQGQVLDELINQELLAQAAEKKGFILDDQALQAHIDELGSEQTLAGWMQKYGYNDETFRQELRLSLEAAWMRDQIVSQVPEKAEQVHARQILLYTSTQADEALAQLKAGKNFAELAAQYDPVTFGDLGWFPRGYLLDKKLEDVAFSLEPGNYSDVIETEAGYHILLVVEKDPQHLLEPDVLKTLQSQAIKDWLQEQRSQSTIEIMAP